MTSDDSALTDCREDISNMMMVDIFEVEEKLFQNGQARWAGACRFSHQYSWIGLEKLVFPDCTFEWKTLTDGTYSLVMKSKDPPCIPDFLRRDPRTPKVSQLHLSVNRMKKIPDGISIFSEVTDVKLDRNKLKSLTQEFTKLKKTKNLDLGNNIFKTFPAEIKEFKDLEVLRFSVNQVEEIPSGVFPCLPNLRNLRIGSNKLKSLPEDLVSLEKLEYLKISSNKFTTFPAQLLQLPCIKQVCLSSNKITEVPLAFFENPLLELFQVDDNPLAEPPQEVCNQGVDAIRQYCQSLKTSTVIVDKRIKLMLLGGTGAGKTSLCLTLKTGESCLVNVSDRTHGIDRHDINEGDVTFLTWDFAGQQDYLVTHPVFITKDALVLLVVNLEKYSLQDEDSYREHIGVWIDNIAMRVPDAVVLVVGTHLDKISEEDANFKLEEILTKIKKQQKQRMDTIKRRIKQLKQELEKPGRTEVTMDLLANLEEKQDVRLRVYSKGIHLSSAEGLQGYDIFKQTLQHLAHQHLGQARRKIPVSWTQVEKLMKGKVVHTGVIYINEAVDDILRETEVTTTHEAKVILLYLHGLGLLIWYSEINCLKAYIFVDPSVLVDVFKVVIRDGLQNELDDITMDEVGEEGMTSTKFKVQRKKFQTKALMDHRILSILWKKAKAKQMLRVKEDENLLVNVLKQFQLCFPYTPPEPDQLNPTAPVFHPGSPWTPPNKVQPTQQQLRKSTMYLFPCYLQESLPQQEWSDPCPQEKEQIRVGLAFFPEVPYGFFERLCVCLHQVSPGVKLWKDCAKVCQNRVEMVLRKHRGQHGDTKVTDLQGNWNDPTIELVARGNKSDAGEEAGHEHLWDPVLRVLGVVQSLLTLWPGVNIEMFSLCPHCDTEVFEVPLPVRLESDQGQGTYCETCEGYVPHGLVYPIGTASPVAEILSQYPLVNNESYFYTYNIHGSTLTDCQVGSRNRKVVHSPTEGAPAGQARGEVTTPPGSAYSGDTANKGAASSPPRSSSGVHSSSLSPMSTGDGTSHYSPANSDYTCMSSNQPRSSYMYSQPMSPAPRSWLSTLARSMGSLQLEQDQASPDRAVLGLVSQNLPIRSWKPLARNLGLSDTDIEVIEHDFPHDANEQKYQMLLLWSRHQSSADGEKVSRLRNALCDVQCGDLAATMWDTYKQGQNSNTTPKTACPSSSVPSPDDDGLHDTASTETLPKQLEPCSETLPKVLHDDDFPQDTPSF